LNNLNNLKIPEKYKIFLFLLLSSLQKDDRIDEIILFGSCAKQKANEYSDIDIAIITKEQLSIEEELSFYDYLLGIDLNKYIDCDMLIISREKFDSYKDSSFCIQKYIDMEGVKLHESV